MEFRWSFSNEGHGPSKPISHVEALDLNADLSDRPFTVFHSFGGSAVQTMDDPNLGFALKESNGGVTTLSGNAGRSSDRDLPFFLIHARNPDEGIFIGVGWSGQWQATIDGSKIKQGLHITAEMPDINLALP